MSRLNTTACLSYGLPELIRRNTRAIGVSASCYGVGIVVGALVAFGSVGSVDSPLASASVDSSAWALFKHNAGVSVLLCASLVTFGVLTGLVLIANGAILSFSVVEAIRIQSPTKVACTLLLHAPIEVLATIVAGAVGFGPLLIVMVKLDGRATPRIGPASIDSVIMTALSITLLIPAALLEFYVSAGITR